MSIVPSGNAKYKRRRKPSPKEQKCRNDCPQYNTWDENSRAYDLPKRHEEHLQQRKHVFEECVYASMDALMKILLHFFGEQHYKRYFLHKHENHICSECSVTNCKLHNTANTNSCVNCEISYEIEPSLMAHALLMAKQHTDQWSGVQLSQCHRTIDTHQAFRTIDTYQAFLEIAFNRQDRTSWKYTGKHFFVPAVKTAIHKFERFVQRLTEKIRVVNDQNLIHAIYELLCCGLIYFIMSCTAKFKRSKAKPLLRPSTLFNSQELRDIFVKCNPGITVDIWRKKEINAQHAVRIDSKGRRLKRNVREVLHQTTKHECLSLYTKKIQIVCNILKIQLPKGFVDEIIKGEKCAPVISIVNVLPVTVQTHNNASRVHFSSQNNSNNNSKRQISDRSNFHSNDGFINANRERRRAQQLQQRQNNRQTAFNNITYGTASQTIDALQQALLAERVKSASLKQTLEQIYNNAYINQQQFSYHQQFSYQQHLQQQQQQSNINNNITFQPPSLLPMPIPFHIQTVPTFPSLMSFPPMVHPSMPILPVHNNNNPELGMNFFSNASGNSMMNVVGDVSSNHSSPLLPTIEGIHGRLRSYNDVEVDDDDDDDDEEE